MSGARTSAWVAAAPREPERSARTVSAWLRSHVLALVASLGVAAGFAWLLRAGALPVIPMAGAWSSVRPAAVVAYAALFFLGHVMRCTRWTLLVSRPARPSLSLSLWIGLVSYGAIVLLPFRLGEAVRPVLLHSRARLPLGTCAGVVVAERILDGLILSTILLAALLGARLVSPLPDHIGQLPIPASIIPRVAWAGVAVFGSLSLSMLAFYLWQAPICRLIERHLGRVSPTLAHRLAETVESVAKGFRFIEDLETGPIYAVVTAFYWVLNVGSIWLLLWAAGLPSPTVAQAVIILGVMGLGLAVPNAPGYFGTFQISTYSAMVLFFPLAVVTRAGSAFVFLLYTVQMGGILCAAAAALGWGGKPGRLPPRPEPEALGRAD